MRLMPLAWLSPPPFQYVTVKQTTDLILLRSLFLCLLAGKGSNMWFPRTARPARELSTSSGSALTSPAPSENVALYCPNRKSCDVWVPWQWIPSATVWTSSATTMNFPANPSARTSDWPPNFSAESAGSHLS